MSASERLRELVTFDYLGPDPNDMDGENWGDSLSGESAAKLLAALPLIADVVEAAEKEVPLLRGRVLERAMEQRERDGLGFALAGSPTLAALTALREALEGKDL